MVSGRSHWGRSMRTEKTYRFLRFHYVLTPVYIHRQYKCKNNHWVLQFCGKNTQNNAFPGVWLQLWGLDGTANRLSPNPGTGKQGLKKRRHQHLVKRITLAANNSFPPLIYSNGNHEQSSTTPPGKICNKKQKAKVLKQTRHPRNKKKQQIRRYST